MNEQDDPREFDPPAVTDPGWYRDPEPGAPAFGRRYWDGSHWTDQLSPQPPKPVARPEPYLPPTTPTSGPAEGAAAATEAQLATLPPPTGLPLERAPQATASWPPAGVAAPPPPPPPPPSKRRWYSNGLLWWAAGVLVLIAVAVAVIATRGDDSSTTPAAPRPTASQPVDVAGQPNVIAYVDPVVETVTLNDLITSTTKDLQARSLDFRVNGSNANHTISLTPNHRGIAQKDIFAAATLLQGGAHILAVETPTARNAPYCGTVPSNRMDQGTRGVVDALQSLHLGEQDLDYYMRTHSGTVSLYDTRIQIRVDVDFRNALVPVTLQGPAAVDLQNVRDIRVQYDALLDAAANAIAGGDTPGFNRLLDQAEAMRGRDDDAIDLLRSDLGLPLSICSFRMP